MNHQNQHKVFRKLGMVEGDLERAEYRAEQGESKSRHLEEELKTVCSSSKSLEAQAEKYSLKEDRYEEEIRNLSNKLKEAESRAEAGERTVSRLERTIDSQEGSLTAARNANMELQATLDQTMEELNSC
ncbi:tropomyosin alpha-4 chain-like [Gymnodraco acuticeps]|uniref:Tropomyosin alpha-4 chain-like n=1 Tax=Gymnodraco acuticeps TaxID=8218 RepID=A0A6P8VEA1_GYMAC|nr:tropomyosin alpha-4 chain-like [Gymnodraco acuticeps]